MVLKHRIHDGEWFENDVKMYGTQTDRMSPEPNTWFENDVKMYGTQTTPFTHFSCSLFENDVKMYGTQTAPRIDSSSICLRMM